MSEAISPLTTVGEQEKKKRVRQRDALSGLSRDTMLRPRDIRGRVFDPGDLVMGPCSENEIIEGTVLKVERRGGVWKLCIEPYRIGGAFFNGYIRWVEKYWRFIKLPRVGE